MDINRATTTTISVTSPAVGPLNLKLKTERK